MITIRRTNTGTGKTLIHGADTLRDAERFVFYSLYDNTNMGKQAATAQTTIIMQWAGPAKGEYVQGGPYQFTIDKGTARK